jgi:hypothetical protein
MPFRHRSNNGPSGQSRRSWLVVRARDPTRRRIARPPKSGTFCRASDGGPIPPAWAYSAMMPVLWSQKRGHRRHAPGEGKSVDRAGPTPLNRWTLARRSNGRVVVWLRPRGQWARPPVRRLYEVGRWPRESPAAGGGAREWNFGRVTGYGGCKSKFQNGQT